MSMSEEKFWSKVDIREPDECWAWLAGKDTQGYGQCWINKEHLLAHRYSWVLRNGEIPTGLIIRHKCKGKCVNPNHLELGTYKDNTNDRIRDGTNVIVSKLIEEQVREIRTRKDKNGYELAKEYKISKSTVYDILSGKSWAWLI